MTARRIALAAAVVLAATAARAQAPGSASLSFEALARAPTGAWAEYALTVNGQASSTMRYSLVAKTAKAMALEIETVSPVAIVMRMDFQPNGAAAWKLTRIRMKMGTGSVQEVPPPAGADQIIKKVGAFGALLATETLKTPAGSFVCKRYKQTTTQGEGEVWMSDQAAPTGLVQTTVASLKAKITLTAVGSGAIAKIP